MSFKISKGYLEIKAEGHHINKHKYIGLHVIIYEEYHKCCMLKWGVVHHINEDRTDNRIENLMGITRWGHVSIHKRKDMSNRSCIECGGNTLIDKNGWRHWYKHPITKAEWLCRNCWFRINYQLRKLV